MNTRAFSGFLFIWIVSAMTSACAPEPESARGFRLPDGDADRGRESFVSLQCNACHQIEGIDMPFLGTGAASVTLGGEVTRVRSYGELVTSIINPSHEIAPGYADETFADGESLMTLASINDAMTIAQLIDIVAFLQPQYEIRQPEHDPYTYIYFP